MHVADFLEFVTISVAVRNREAGAKLSFGVICKASHLHQSSEARPLSQAATKGLYQVCAVHLVREQHITRAPKLVKPLYAGSH